MKMLVDLFLDIKPKDVNVPKKTLKKLLLHTGEKHNLSIHFKTHLYYLSSHTHNFLFLTYFVHCLKIKINIGVLYTNAHSLSCWLPPQINLIN